MKHPNVTVTERQNVVFLARVVDELGAISQQADVSSVLVRVYKDPSTDYVFTASPTVASTVFDAFQTDARWDADSTGYSFRYTITGQNVFTAGGGRYRCEFMLTMAAGDEIGMIAFVDVDRLYTKYELNATAALTATAATMSATATAT